MLEFNHDPQDLTVFAQNILAVYPGIRQKIEAMAKKNGNRNWTRFKELIQENGWSSEVEFDWRSRDGEIIIDHKSLTLNRLRPAPPANEQYDVD